MAIDSWMPRRFASLSERLTTRNGILLMGGAAMAALIYTHGDVRHLVVMYSINVFLTFSMTMLGMCRLWITNRRERRDWNRKILIHALGFVMCATIFVVIVVEKFGSGGWVTVLITASVVALCVLIRRHYRTVYSKLQLLYASLAEVPELPDTCKEPVDPRQPTAVVMVAGFGGLGLHTALNVPRMFPNQFHNYVFVSVGVLDSKATRTDDTMKTLEDSTRSGLIQYSRLFKRHGMSATYRMSLGTDLIAELERLCLEVTKEFPRATFFSGHLVFQRERWYHSILHNQTAYALQKRLQLAGHTMVIIPARVE
jgi:hypothetical protein